MQTQFTFRRACRASFEYLMDGMIGLGLSNAGGAEVALYLTQKRRAERAEYLAARDTGLTRWVPVREVPEVTRLEPSY
jgi:hypothetical protein